MRSPPWMAQWTRSEATETQTPPDLAAMLALVVCSAAVSKKYVLHVRGAWSEPLNLYAVAAMSPGNRKSAVFSHATRPLMLEQQRLTEATRASVERARRELELYERQKKVLVRAAAQDSATSAPAKGKLGNLPDPPVIPTSPRLLADDTTPEAIVRLLSENDGRIAVLAPEGGILTTLSGAYTEKVNIDAFLKGWGGESIVVDRIGRSSLFVATATLTIGLTVQPNVLVDLVANDVFRGRGLSGRFLYFFPSDLLGRRQVDAPTMPSEVSNLYEQEVRRLLALPLRKDARGLVVPSSLALTPEADAVRADYERIVEHRLGEDGDLHHMTDWGGKLTGAVVRVAGVLHLAGGAAGNAVSEDTMLAATRIGDYLIEHARAAYASVGVNADDEGARHVLRWLQRSGHDSFTKRDAHNALRPHFGHARDLDPVLDQLVEKKYLRNVSPPYGGKGQPSSPRFAVNPGWLAQNTQNAQKSV